MSESSRLNAFGEEEGDGCRRDGSSVGREAPGRTVAEIWTCIGFAPVT